MLKKSFVFMMLLAASLVGIGSAIHYQLEVTTAQPQPNPNTAPPTLGKRLTGPQGQQQQQSNTGTLVQIQQDKALVDRLFPYIIQKIDGKTLAQKIDAATLLQKIDGNLLAQKVFPFLDLSVTTIERPGQEAKVDITGPFSEKTAIVKASCAPEERLVGGAMHARNLGELDWFQRSQQLVDPNRFEDSWVIITTFDRDGSIASFAECLKVELVLKQ